MTWCPLPFRHVFVEPRGVKPCCSFTETQDGSVSQWLDSDRLQSLTNNILSGKIDPGCEDCVRHEIKTGTSTRLSALTDYGDDVFDSVKIDYVDYRASNICNFRCRSCEPYFSNGIAQDVRKSAFLQRLHEIPPEKISKANDPEWIMQNLSHIRRLMFTGGEPTIMPGVRQIIEAVRDQGTNTQVILITNGSFTDSYWLDLARHMPNINFTVSIDAVGDAAAIIRHGSDWNVIQSNIHYLAQHSHSVNFSTVITGLNLFQLAPLLRFTKAIRDEYDLPNGRTQFMQVCKHPGFLDPVNWPSDLRAKALHYLGSILHWEDHVPTRQILSGLISAIHTHVYDVNQWQTAQQYHRELDMLRQENHCWLYEPQW